MEMISVSQFKATCFKKLAQVKKSGRPLMVTKWGEPLAVLSPPPAPKKGNSFGAMKGSVEFLGDIVEPFSKQAWEALKNS